MIKKLNDNFIFEEVLSWQTGSETLDCSIISFSNTFVMEKLVPFFTNEDIKKMFDESSTEDRHELVKELLEGGFIAKYEDLKDVLDRSASSAERYIKQAIESGIFKENQWKEWKLLAKNGRYSREERIKKGKEYLKNKYRVRVNEPGRGGRYVVERKIFEPENDDF